MASNLVFETDLGTLKCLGCNEQYKMALPASFDMVMAIINAFKKTHRFCKAKEVTNG